MNRPRIPWITMLIIGLVVVMISSQVTADNPAMPRTLSYQGRLTDDQGQPITNTFSMTFTIYDAESDGESKWSETHPSVSVVNGLFSVVLGEGTPAVPVYDTVFSNPDRWLEIIADGETVIPRTKFTSSPYSLQAGWTMINDVLYTGGNWGIARDGSVLLGDYWDYRYDVNMGTECTTGAVGSGSTGPYNTIGGGKYNVARGHEDDDDGGATVSGGYGNRALIRYSTIAGGIYNTADLPNDPYYYGIPTVGGGGWNSALAGYATVGGGRRDSASGFCSTIPGGDHCTAAGRFSFATGRNAKARHNGTWVWADTTDEDFESTGPNQFLIRASGNVGINSTTPMSPLHVQSANNWAPQIGNGWGDFNVGDTTHGLSIGVATEGGGAGSVRLWTAGGNGNLTFANATNGDLVTILGTGEVGLGGNAQGFYIREVFDTSSADWGSLIVTNGIGIGSATGTNQQMLLLADGSGGENVLVFTTSTNNGTTWEPRLSIDQEGDVGIGTEFAGEELTVEGDICYTNSIYQCSDSRYKKDIETIDAALDKVSQLRGVTYGWRKDEFPDKKFDDGEHTGFIAQEIKDILPNVITTDDNGYMSVDYSRVTPLLVEAVKELKAENDAKENRINDLQAQLDQLSAQMHAVLEKIK